MNNEIKSQLDLDCKKIKLLHYEKKWSYFWPIFLSGFIFFFTIPLFLLVYYRNNLCDITIKELIKESNDEELIEKEKKYYIQSKNRSNKVRNSALKLLMISYISIAILIGMFFIIFGHANFG